MNRNVVVIATHPDDEVLGCGGVTARHAARGDVVHVVVVTKGITEMFPPESVATTREELAQAHEILKVRDVTFLDFPAPRLDSIPNYQIADAIRVVIEHTKPHVVYLPHRGDLHNDHKATFWAAVVATRPNGNLAVPRVLCYETLSETEWGAPSAADAFLPTVFVDISRYLPEKLRAAGCYRSQLKQFPHPRSIEAIEALARWRGSQAGLPAAEAFVLLREVIAE